MSNIRPLPASVGLLRIRRRQPTQPNWHVKFHRPAIRIDRSYPTHQGIVVGAMENIADADLGATDWETAAELDPGDECHRDQGEVEPGLIRWVIPELQVCRAVGWARLQSMPGPSRRL